MPLLESDIGKSVISAICSQMSALTGPDGDVYVTVPIYYATGSAVVARIHKSSRPLADTPLSFVVSDACQGYREADAMGVGRTYVRQAGDVARRLGVPFEDHEFSIQGVTVDQLAWAAVTIAGAATEAVAIAMQRVEEAERLQESELLYNRLVEIFQKRNVSKDAEITGSSNTPWRVDAIVNTQYRKTVFEWVSSHHNSVFAAVSKMTDIKALEQAPDRIVVVRKKAALKTYHALLANAATVVERDISTEALRRQVSPMPLAH